MIRDDQWTAVPRDPKMEQCAIVAEACLFPDDFHVSAAPNDSAEFGDIQIFVPYQSFQLKRGAKYQLYFDFEVLGLSGQHQEWHRIGSPRRFAFSLDCSK